MVSKILGPAEKILAEKTIELSALDKPHLLKFANVDHRLIFEFGNEKLTYDLGRSVGDVGEMLPEIQSQVKIFGMDDLSISNVAIFRDIHSPRSI